MKKPLLIIPLVLLLCLTSACKQQAEEVERFMEDGAEVVVNHIEPHKIKGEPITLHIEEEFAIDIEKNGIAELGLTEMKEFDVDSEGFSIFNLFPLENGNYLAYGFNFDPSTKHRMDIHL
jgi:hypothetical protein